MILSIAPARARRLYGILTGRRMGEYSFVWFAFLFFLLFFFF